MVQGAHGSRGEMRGFSPPISGRRSGSFAVDQTLPCLAGNNSDCGELFARVWFFSEGVVGGKAVFCVHKEN